MKKKYLYNGQLMEEADVQEAADQSNLDFHTYAKKAGIQMVDDSYSLNGKNFSAQDVLDAANQSKLGFDDYIQKAGFQKKSQNGNGLSNGSPTELQSQGGDDLSGRRPAAYPLPQQPAKAGFKTGLNLQEPAAPPQEPSKEVSPTAFLAHHFGMEESDFEPHKIYNNASEFIRKDLEKHPLITDAPYPERMKEQVIKGDGEINIQKYTQKREAEITQQQDDIFDKILEAPDGKTRQTYKDQIAELETQKQQLKTNAQEINDVQAVTQTPIPTDPTKQTDYFREIGRNVNRFNDPIGIANQEKNLKDGTSGARDKELVDVENYANEQAGIEAKKKQLSIAAANGEIYGADLGNQLADIKLAESKLLANNPGAKNVMDRNTISRIIEETRNSKKTPTDPNEVQPFSGTLFHDIINYTPSEKEVKDAIETAREQGSAISPEEEKKYIEDRAQIPGTSALGNLFNSSIVSTGTAINEYNPFLSKQEIEGEKYRVGQIFQPVQRQTEGVLGYVNQTANVVGTVLKWGTLGKFLGAAADVGVGAVAGAETIGGVPEVLGGIRKLNAVQQNIAGTALTAGLLVYPEAKEEASKFTTDEGKQEAYAGTITLLNTLAFTALNSHGIINKIMGNIGETSFTKDFLKVVNDAGGIEKLAPETYKATILKGLKDALGANVSATATMTALNVAEQATDVMFGKKPNFDMNETAKTAINSFVEFAPISLLQGAVGAIGSRKQRNVAIQLINQAAKDPIAFKAYMDNAVNEGKISREDANKKIQIVNTNASLRQNDVIPAHLSEENKAIYADNLRRELVLQKEVKESVDPIQIAAKNEEIKILQEERKNIVNFPTGEGDIVVNKAREDKQLGVYGSLTNDEILKEIAKQAQNVQQDGTLSKLQSPEEAYNTTVRQFGGNKELVDAAIAKHPQESLLKPEIIPNRNDDFVKKYFPEGSSEKAQFDKLDEEGQSKMISDKREELQGTPKASVKTQITKQDEKDLSDLGYSSEDIYKMKPVDAGEILSNKTAKEIPVSEYRTNIEAEKIMNEKLPWAKKYNTDVDFTDPVTGETKNVKTHRAIDELSTTYKKLKSLIVDCL